MTTHDDHLEVSCPLPPDELKPNYTANSKVAKIIKTKKTKEYRTTIGYLVKIQGGSIGRHIKAEAAKAKPLKSGRYRVPLKIRAVIYHKSKRTKMDNDNRCRYLKTLYDGIQDALNVGDNLFNVAIPEQDYDNLNPRVDITVDIDHDSVCC